MSLVDDDDREQRERQKALDRLERAPRGPSVVDGYEEQRLYELNRQGIDAAIDPDKVRRCPDTRRRHKSHEWKNGNGESRYCPGAK